MFVELEDLLKERSISIMVSRDKAGLIHLHIIPFESSEAGTNNNAALRTPLACSAPAAQLDSELPGALREYVDAHLQLGIQLAEAKETMAAAAAEEKKKADEKKKKAEEKKADEKDKKAGGGDKSRAAASAPVPEPDPEPDLFSEVVASDAVAGGKTDAN